MITKSLKLTIYAVALIATLATPILAQDKPIQFQPNPDSPIGERNKTLLADATDFDFLIGDWDVVITWTPPNGAPPNTYKAKWHNHWTVNGTVVMQEWRGPYATGAEMRHYNGRSKSWSGQNIYQRGKWQRTTASTVGENLIVIIHDVKRQEREFDNRETYYDIEKDSFKMKSDLSYDDGKTWETGRYSMTVTRATP